MWLVYPQPVRAYVRLSAQFIAVICVLLAGLVIVAVLVHFVDWLIPDFVRLVHH
jgi:hypothetical protein